MSIGVELRAVFHPPPIMLKTGRASCGFLPLKRLFSMQGDLIETLGNDIRFPRLTRSATGAFPGQLSKAGRATLVILPPGREALSDSQREARW